MPVSMEFSIARRKLVSLISACCACTLRRVWRQVPSSVQTVSALNALTSQKNPLPTTPKDVV